MTRGPGELLKKIAFRHAIGVYVGDQHVTVCRAALSLAGPVALSSRTVPYEPDRLSDALDVLLRPIAAGRRIFRPLVSVGLPTLRVFFATKPMQATDRDIAPNVLLHEVLRSSNVNVDEMEVDLIRAQPGKKPLALLVAGRRKYLTGVLAALERLGIRPHRTEPAPFALARLATFRHRGPRKARVIVRIFLGEAQGVAVLVADELPLSWRVFELPEGAEAAAVCATAKAIQVVARFRGDVGAPDAVMIHGRPELAATLGAEAFKASLGVRSQCFPDPGYDPESIALGLAVGARQGEEAFDLSRALKPRAPFWQVFPVGDAALQVAVLTCVTLFLQSKDDDARHAFHAVRAGAARHKWIDKVSDDALDKEKKDLGRKIEAVRDFLDTRILWSAYTRDASVRLPESIVMASFAGLSELPTAKSQGRPRRSFTFKLSATIVKGQGMPREIDEYLGTLRRDPLLQRDFPVVELADLRWGQASSGTRVASAEFTVNCLPAPAKPQPRTNPAAKTATPRH